AQDALKEQIEQQLKRLKETERQTVEHHISLGRTLTKYKNRVRKRWLKELETLGIAPRVASRYLLLGKYWATEQETPGSDLLPRLPADLHKLEWLCRLKRRQLRKLCEKMNLRDATRGEVIEAVKKELGEPPNNDDEPPVEKARKKLENYVERLL